MTTEKNAAQNYFGAGRSSTYDRKIRASLPGYEALHAMVDDLLRFALPERAQLLVAGAGTGMELVTLGAAHPDWRFTATDRSAEMLAIGKANVEAAGLADRMTFHVGEMHELPETPPFDGATSLLVSHFIRPHEARGRFFRAIASRLRPGAPFITAEVFGDRQDLSFSLFLEAWKGHYAAAGIPAQEVAEDFARTDATVAFLPGDAFATLLAENGFTDVRRFFQAFLFGAWVARRAAEPGP